MLYSVLAISLGASVGAVFRWLATNSFNTFFPHLPPGTLMVNLAGGYLMGVALAWLANNPTVSVEWRLLILTGFLGSLTTFSTFSAEVVGLLHQDKTFWALTTISTHVVGSLLMTFLGLATVKLIGGSLS